MIADMAGRPIAAAAETVGEVFGPRTDPAPVENDKEIST
jgi:hypothetical protein